jgi:hypothetical protein
VVHTGSLGRASDEAGVGQAGSRSFCRLSLNRRECVPFQSTGSRGQLNLPWD